MAIVKRTVIIEANLDRFVRATQAILLQAEPAIEQATYSAALNFMLMAAVQEGSRAEGLSPQTRDVVWDFARDTHILKELALHERLDAVRTDWLDRERS